MGFMFCDLHVSLKLPFIGGYKFDEFVLFIENYILFLYGSNRVASAQSVRVKW